MTTTSEQDSGLDERCASLLTELGLGCASDIIEVTPLTGGVASDIALVRVSSGGGSGGGSSGGSVDSPDSDSANSVRNICMKFALPKLQVEADWFAPVERNSSEYSWLEAVSLISPNNSVRLYGCSPSLHGFAMEFLGGDDVRLWKSALLSESPDRGEASAVGDLVGRIHSASSSPDFDVSPFQNFDYFWDLRLEPYLIHSSLRHTDVSPHLESLASELSDSRSVLIHGDVSPKNIMFRNSVPVILDAECATMGDPSFDVSFCLNHLVLKAVHLCGSRSRYLSSILNFWDSYSSHITWEPVDLVESRICRLLPALMLARIDGKSPVEYLTSSEREVVRDCALGFIVSPSESLGVMVDSLMNFLEGSNL